MGVLRQAASRRFFGIAAATTVILSVAVVPFTTGTAGAAPSVSLAQCANGPLTGPVACNNATSSYQNGDLNQNNSHYKEGDFVPYTLQLSGLSSGTNTIQFGYRVGDSGKHAQDYLGSYDATETTSSTPSAHNANNNNPCDGLTMATACTPSSPTSTVAVTAPDFTGMDTGCGTSGTFPPANFIPGTIDLFGAPTGSTLSNFTYVDQNQNSASGCVTDVSVRINLSAALTGGQTIVLAWGGHVASQEDWGAGNSASFINGSPYHMFLDSLNGGSIGSQDHQMKTSAIFFTPSVSTTIINESTNSALSGPINLGTTVHDTATLSNASATAGGKITFTLRNDTGTTACAGTTIGTPQVVTFSNGAANSPNSVSTASFTPTTGGSYSYQAVYSGDTADVPGNFTSACEPFTVQGNTPTLATQAQFSTDNTTFSNVPSTPISIGNWVRDTSTLSGAATPVAGSVKYTLYSGTGCTGNTPNGTVVFTSNQTGASSATLPNSGSFQVTTAQSYQWQAVFTTGNTQNTNATSPCGSETFTVGPNAPTISTVAQVSTDGGTTYGPITGNIAIGNSVRDTSSLTGAAAPTTGTVTYTLYNGSGCDTSTNTPTGSVAFTSSGVALGSPSGSFSITTAGTYQWQAVYMSGNTQNTNATSQCGTEVFTVNPNSPTLSTTAQSSTDNVTFAPFTGALTIGTFVRDTSTLNGAATPTTGTVQYFLYQGTGCTSGTPNGSVVFSTTPISLTSGGDPQPSGSFQVTSAGNYQWQAVYMSGNGQNNNATSPCGSEVFTVNPNSPTLSTTAQSSTDNITFGPITSAVAINDFVRDTSSLTGTATPVAGTIVYTLYSGDGCSSNTPTGTVEFQTSALTVSSATPPNSDSFQVTTAGTYQWQAVFTASGGQNNSATSQCGTEVFMVGPNNPVLSTTAQVSTDGGTTYNAISGNIAIGNMVRDTSSLSSAATPVAGTVVYTLYSGDTCNANLPEGTIEFQTGSLPVTSAILPPSGGFQVTSAGTYQWQAVFTSKNGQNSNATSQCGTEVFTVNPNNPTLSTTAQVSTDGGTTYSAISGNIAIGNMVRDTSSLSGAATPVGGSVVYTLYSGNGCDTTTNTPTGTIEYQTIPPLAVTSATPPNSGPFTVTTAGTYQWQAVFTTSNGQNNSATSPCGSEVFTVNPNSPMLSTTAQVSTDGGATYSPIVGNIAIGNSVRDTSSLSGAATPVAGTVIYTLYSGSGCSGNTPTGTVVYQTVPPLTVSSATPPNSGSFTVTTAGAYQWQAVFTSTNGQNNSATSQCGTEGFTVNPNSPTLSTAAQVSTDGGSTYNPISGNIAIGNLVRDTSSLSGAATPIAGSIVYTLYSGDGCDANTPTGTVVYQTVPPLTVSSATPPNSGSFTVTSAGDYQWQAVFTTGNGQNNNATSPCGSEVFTVGPNNPTLSTTAESSTDNVTFGPITAPLAINDFVRDTSSLSGAATPVAGSIVYTLYSGSGCDANTPTGTVEFQTSALTVSSATPPNSGSFQVTTAGTYQWQAVFTASGGQNNSATSPCGSEVFTVNPNSPTLSTTAEVSTDGGTTYNPITGNIAIGNVVRDTSTLSGAATPTAGNVTYNLYDGSGCNSSTGAPSGSLEFTSVVPLGSPSAPGFPITTAGTYQWQAVFGSTNPQNNNATSQCGTEVFTVNSNSPTLGTTAQVSTDGGTTYNPITSNIAIGNVVRDTSSLTGAATPVAGTVVYTLYTGNGCDGNSPTGTVAFQTGSLQVTSAALPDSGSFTVTTAGDYQWQAVFASSNGQNNSATSQCGTEDFTVSPNSPTLSTTAQSSTDNVAFSDMTGSVTIGTFVRDTSALSGAAMPTTGSVAYTLYSGNGCDGNDPTGTVVFTDTETLASNTIPPSASIQLNTAGDYQWQAVFTAIGGQNNNATSPCGSEAFTVTTPNFTIMKTNVPGNGLPVTPGSTIPYTITVQNVGDGPGTATIEDVLPSSLTMSGAPTCTVTDPSTDTCTVPSSAVTTLDATVTLASGHTATITFNAVLAATDTADVVNTASIKTGVCTGNLGTQQPSVESHAVTLQCSSTVTNPVPNFTVTKTNVPGNGLPVAPGSTVPYTIAIKNVGDGAGSATITDTLPSNLTIQGTPSCAVTGSDTCVVTNTTGSTWTFAVTLAAGDTATATFSAKVAATATGTITNTATITTGPCNTSSGCSSTVSNPLPNFTVTKTNVPGNGQSVTAGSTIPYTIAIKNVGDGAGSATITDTLPSNLTIQGTPSCAVTGSDTCKVTNTTGSTWTFAVTLAAGDTATATFSAKVAATATGTVTNTATITTGPCNTSSGCSSTVSNPIPPVTTPATTPPATTTTTAPPVTKPSGIAFTGADIAGMAAGGLALIGLGGLLLLVSRRRRQSSGEIA